jgi:hypothetical protein
MSAAQRDRILMMLFASVFIALGFGACSTQPKRTELQSPPQVLLPKVTPFDASPAKRAEYREGYREGYRTAYSGNLIFRLYSVKHSALPPRLQGWNAGHYAGMGASMEKELRVTESKSGYAK